MSIKKIFEAVFSNSDQKNRVVINGEVFTGNRITIDGSNVVVDGKVQSTIEQKIVNVSVEGWVASLTTVSGDVSITGDCDHIKTVSGDVKVSSLHGDVETVSGDVTATTITGSVKTLSGDIRGARK